MNFKVIGDINASIGKAQLLIRERFNQFSKLITDCENKSSEKEIRMDDLNGFWEMISIQIEDVISQFKNLELIKANDWKPIVSKAIKEEKKVQKNTKTSKKPLINYQKIRPTFRRPKTQLKPVNK